MYKEFIHKLARYENEFFYEYSKNTKDLHIIYAEDLTDANMSVRIRIHNPSLEKLMNIGFEKEVAEEILKITED